jgi:hypothetical protein
VILPGVAAPGQSSPIALEMFGRSPVITCDKIKESRKIRSNTVGILDADCPPQPSAIQNNYSPCRIAARFCSYSSRVMSPLSNNLCNSCV